MFEKIVNFFFSLFAILLLAAIGYMLFSLTETRRVNRELSGVVLPTGSVGVLELRQVPRFQLVARDVHDPNLLRMHEMDVALSRVVTRRGFGRIRPLVIELPDTEWKIGDERPITYALPLPDTQSITISNLSDYYVTFQETRPTICYAVKGPYNWKYFMASLEKLKKWMIKNNTVPTGRPRILLYNLHSYLPEELKVFEVQIPVR